MLSRLLSSFKKAFSVMTVQAAGTKGTEVTIDATLMNDLSVGEHTFVANFTDGTATMIVEVVAEEDKDDESIEPVSTENSAESGNKDSVPKTGEHDLSLICLLLIMGGLAGLVAAYFEKKTTNS